MKITVCGVFPKVTFALSGSVVDSGTFVELGSVIIFLDLIV